VLPEVAGPTAAASASHPAPNSRTRTARINCVFHQIHPGPAHVRAVGDPNEPRFQAVSALRGPALRENDRWKIVKNLEDKIREVVRRNVDSYTGPTTGRSERSELNRTSPEQLRPTCAHATLRAILSALIWERLFLDEEHHELRRLRTTRVPSNDMLVVGTFIKRLPRCQRYLLPAPYLH